MMWKWSELKALLKKEEEATEPDYSGYAAVMWPALYPYTDTPRYQPREPHCTVIFLGEIDKLNYTVDDVIEALVADPTLPLDIYMQTTVDKLEWFGPEKNVPVLRIVHDQLQDIRQRMVTALNNRGIFWEENYPEYKPHVTITEDAALEGVYPTKIMLRPVEVWWGGNHHRLSE